jgi:enamine deaminase RidA (YjgF/YER057c/UK114 family)
MKEFLLFRLEDLKYTSFQSLFDKFAANYQINNILSVVLFINSESYEDYIKKVKHINEIFQIITKINFNFVIIPQNPIDKFEAIVEIEVLSNDVNFRKKIIYTEILQIFELTIDDVEYIYSTINFENYDLILKLNYDELYRQICFYHNDVYGHRILRMWNYVGNILKLNKYDSSLFQNYQLLNNIRYKNFKHNHIENFPSSTGIGMNLGGLITKTISIKENEKVKISSISNSLQKNAFEYGEEVLVGQGIKYPPLFERALLVQINKDMQLFISGTASIIGQKSIGIGDIKTQTITTLSNINSLIKHANTFIIDQKPFDFKEFIVYIKNIEDYQIVKEIVETKVKNIPIIYTQADICRDELLVEMECYCESFF